MTATTLSSSVHLQTIHQAPSSAVRLGSSSLRSCWEAGLSGNFGTHSLRKTWGYHARMSGVDLALIMHKLNHESIAYTKRYLGITGEELQAVAQRLNL
jgi:site-specific recombinase XerD